MDEKKTDNKSMDVVRKAAEGLWQALTYSSHYKKEYDVFLGMFKRFDQLEHIYICMVAGVPGEKAVEVLKNPGLNEKERVDALEQLWMDRCRKPQPPTEEQDRQIKEMNDRVKMIGMEMAQIQADISKIKTDQERRNKQGGNATFFFMDEEGKQEDKKRLGQVKKEGPFKALSPAPGQENMRMDILERNVAGLKEKIKAQDKEIAKMKDEGTKIRGIILTAPEIKGTLKDRRKRKMLEGEKEKIDQLLEAGYAADQLDFLLQCREEGVPWDTIGLFSGQEIPVELMKKLKDYYTKKMPESGMEEGGGEHGE